MSDDGQKKTPPWFDHGRTIALDEWEAQAIRSVLEASDISDPVGLIASTGADITHFFEHCCFENVDFTNSSVDGVSFSGASLDGCIFTMQQWEVVERTKPTSGRLAVRLLTKTEQKNSSFQELFSAETVRPLQDAYERVRADCLDALPLIAQLLGKQASAGAFASSPKTKTAVAKGEGAKAYFRIGMVGGYYLEVWADEVRLVIPPKAVFSDQHKVLICFVSTGEDEVFDIVRRREDASGKDYLVVDKLFWNDLDGNIATIAHSDATDGMRFMPRLIEQE